MPERWITAREYAATYGLHPRTVWKWCRAGKIRIIRKGREMLVLDPGLLELANPASRIITKHDLMPLFRGEEVAELIGITSRALRYWAKNGKVGFRQVGRSRRYSINDVREIMALRKFNATRVSPQQKRLTIMEWARTRLKQNS